MTFNEEKIKCPKCGELISIDTVLTHQIEEKVKKDFEGTQKGKEDEIAQKSEELKKLAQKIEESQKDIDKVIAEKVTNQLTVEKIKLFKEAKVEAEKEQNSKTMLLEEELKSKNDKLAQATKNEVELRKKAIKLEEDKRAFELEKMRQLEEERKLIVEEANKKATEEQQYVIAQLNKKLTDANKVKDELARKLEQGSQQTQGEVLELELESQLKEAFPQDEIVPVPKGVTGADIVQKVIDRSGRECGQIVWESKKTKAWSDGWIQKLKDDQRAIKADLAVIVSIALPEDVKGFAFRNGVWLCDVKMFIALAVALRMNLEAITREKAMSVGKNEKMEILYSYLTGIEFKQRVEAIVEAFSSMDDSLKKERLAYEKIWSEREQQLKKVIKNTVGMYGDLSGLVALPQIKRLELGE
ncbi:hypothetical protein A3J90_05375 [candidate division WOR-1 bacterium RIFOXYC2_FULL_37_10]|uniref:DUF2130 domain-containing protein n=1 Tax=candidate division WOR-1 bacterium RIFOXYB2_FULL_37_13 TaxID=1802579 RepID=A0A1F4SUX3_UNCSA|nr:MAG: hypothetical protein A2310_06715 [candidate division WOR-1 bacterium RIFOXYB2_FULL_37_13]OGC36465.1 MAG: hypothetical protein A3J90_05375 [candidate division WOR-1 bacterium RIFOXYC2_FULL_37_10]